jgi:carboxymethylenebutenolidase
VQTKPLNDMQQYLVEEFVEEYEAGHLTRRQALRQLTLILGSGAAAAAILAACGTPVASPTAAPAAAPAAAPTAAPTTAAAAATKPAAATQPAASPAATPAAAAKPTPNPVTVQPNDPAITGAGMVDIAGTDVKLTAYQARPAGSGPRPLLIVIHENRGLTEHIQDVVRRAAKAGYIAIGPDLLSRAGGTAKFADPAQATGAIGQLKPEEVIADLKAMIAYGQKLDGAQADRLGVTGFCWGGGQTWRIITQAPEVKAAVPFYGPAPALDQVKNIKAAVLGIYAGNDERINAGIPDLEKALKEANITYQIKIYPGVNHAFHNDTGANYNADAAKDAWNQAIAWFDKYLKA